MRRASRRPRFAAAGAAIAILALLAPGLTSAGFTDSTFAKTAVSTTPVAEMRPVVSDLSAASALELTEDGVLYVSGYRGTGDGNGSLSVPPTADPTKVQFPKGVRIIDAGAATNDYHAPLPATTSFMALDDQGRVWTWGKPFDNANLIGRGNISDRDAAFAGQVTRTETGAPLPPIVSMARIENQFLALDDSGTMWAWGWGGENLPYHTNAVSRPMPFAVKWTGANIGNLGCRGAANAGEVTWHSIWGGANGTGAVGRDGLVYSWGWDAGRGTRGSLMQKTTCPALNEGANRALFQRYPDLYQTADGQTYDEAELTSERARSARYQEIVNNMRGKVLPACDGSKRTGQVDESDCPVRQLGYDARHSRMLTQDGELLTWRLGTLPVDGLYNKKFLGRTPTDAQPADVPAPIAGSLKIDRVVAGVSHLVALTRDGEVVAWGDNNVCQAIGAPTQWDSIVAGSCANRPNTGWSVEQYWVTLPTPVAGLPEGARVTTLTSTQCATWAELADGSTYAWGAGTASGANFNLCNVPTAEARGYKIYLTEQATPKQPFGPPVTDVATGTVKVK